MSASIVHIGFGAFHRAHQLVYAQSLKNIGAFPWSYCAVSLNRTADIEALRQQDYIFHVWAQDCERAELHEVNVVSEALHPKLDGFEAIVEKIADLNTKIISFTVTEKAYYIQPGSMRLDCNNAQILYDLDHAFSEPARSQTIFGLLAAGLQKRREGHGEGLALLSCDNVRSNGKVLASALIQFCEKANKDLAEWIKKEITFPCTMVDRIVPKMNAEARDLLEKTCGRKDAVGVVCEGFSQWVIEDRFPHGRPDWESVGVEMVSDVTPYEEMKLRMLNGAHSFIAYAGASIGCTSVSEFMQNERNSALVRHFMLQEQAASISHHDVDQASRYEQYADALIERFKNPNLAHKLLQIAMDGSQKIPQRIVPALLINTSKKNHCELGVLAIAIWLNYIRLCSQGDIQGNSEGLQDPQSKELLSCFEASADCSASGKSILENKSIFPVTFIENKILIPDILKALVELKICGVNEVLNKRVHLLKDTALVNAY
ncbi:MAG: mannitol dehydrogenase family protein [Agarilytica sp.]